MSNTFSKLMATLAIRVPMQRLEVTGREMSRIARFTPEEDGKERILYWRGNYPKETEFDSIIEDFICHFELQSTPSSISNKQEP